MDTSICKPISFAECKDGSCACIMSTEISLQYGTCTPKVIGSQCSSDAECAHLNHAFCNELLSSKIYVCSCRMGYKPSKPSQCILKQASLDFSYQIKANGMNERLSTCLYEFETGVRYTVSWMIEDVVIHTNNMTSLEETGFNTLLVEYLYGKYLNLEPVNPCAVDKPWKCTISTFFTNGSEAFPTVYSESFRIIDIENPTVYIPRGGESIFDFTVNLPLWCDPNDDCFLEFMLFDESDQYTCNDSTVAVKGADTCGAIFKGEDKVNGGRSLKTKQRVSMRLSTVNNKKYTLRESFNMFMEIQAAGKVDSFWTKCRLDTTVQIIVRDENRFWKNTLCYVTNDPRLQTFDGQYYSMQLEGEFMLYKHKQYPVEVQIETELCNGGWASCTCGVAIRAGRDLFVVNHCHGDHIVEAINTSDGVLNGVLHSSYSQTFHLPYGTSIEVYYFVNRWWSPMNIYIYPSPNDMNNVEGLCGLFNGNWRDDFLHRGGEMTLSQNYYWWWWGGDPDKFSKSWIVPDAESLLNPERIANLSSWNEDERFCICSKDNDGNREPTCHQNEANWCSQFEENPGTNFGTLTSDRSKRSIPFVDNIDTVERLNTLKNVRTFKRTSVRLKRQVSVSNDSYETAVAECQAYLSANCNGKEAALASSVAGNASNDCAQDKMVDGSLTSSAATESACISTKAVAKQVVERDLELQAAFPNIAQTFKAACIDNCFGNGNCTKTGACECFDGFDPLSNCKVNVSEPPEIVSTTGGGICNPKLKPCETLRYTTKDGCSKKSICKVIAKDFYISGKKVTRETTYIPAICNNGWDAYCSFPFENRRKRTADPVVATEFNTAISNNNVSYSRATKISVLDTTCLTIVEEDIHLKSEFCLIAGHCVPSGAKDPDNRCNYCSPDKNQYDWQMNGCGVDVDNVENVATSDKTVIIVAAVASASALLLLAVLAVCLYMKKVKKRKHTRPTERFEHVNMPTIHSQ